MTKRILRNILLLVAALAVLASPALAQGRGNGKGHGNKNKGNRVDKENNNQNRNEGRGKKGGSNYYRTGRRQVGVTVFGTRDRDLISGYYRNQYSSLPPGLAKSGGNLPPGLERQLERNGTLPPGLQKNFQPFPPELDRQLPPLPPYYSRGVIGTSVVIYNTRTRLIVDVIRDLLNR
ncbi:MAG: hypothetical protein ACYDA9_11320 [Terriglobia bacterium]